MRRRNKQIHFYLTEEELNELDNKVKKTSLTREAYIRAILRDTVPVETPPVDYIQMIHQLNRVGNNLNQIAAKAHSLGLLNYKDFREEAEKVDYVVDIMLANLHPQKKI